MCPIHACGRRPLTLGWAQQPSAAVSAHCPPATPTPGPPPLVTGYLCMRMSCGKGKLIKWGLSVYIRALVLGVVSRLTKSLSGGGALWHTLPKGRLD